MFFAFKISAFFILFREKFRKLRTPRVVRTRFLGNQENSDLPSLGDITSKSFAGKSKLKLRHEVQRPREARESIMPSGTSKYFSLSGVE